MTAKQAKERALSANERDNANQLRRIITSITFAAGKGDFEVNIYDNIKPDVRQSLLNHGYHVSEAMYAGQFVKDAFDEDESIDEWIENNNDELEALSSICSLYNETNLHQYATGQYNHLKEDIK